jgi:hypothetical protein
MAADVREKPAEEAFDEPVGRWARAKAAPVRKGSQQPTQSTCDVQEPLDHANQIGGLERLLDGRNWTLPRKLRAFAVNAPPS